MSRFLLWGVVSFALVACGGGGGDGTTAPKPVPVASVSVSLTSSTLLPGRTTTAVADVRSAAGDVLSGRSVSWSSSNTAIATVDGSGNVTAVAAGSATITATSEGKSGSATLTVMPPVASVLISGSTRVKVGDSYTYTVTAKLADGTVVNRPITWSTSDPARATISQSGVLLPITTGAFRIQATIDGSLWDSGYSAYDWNSFASGTSQFTTIESDNTIIGRRNIAEYPQLIFSCNSTSGNFFAWVSFTNFITNSGSVAMSFDDAAPFSTTWSELSPDYSTLWKPGTNAAVKAFATQVAAARLFGFAFTEFLGSAKAMIFRVSGLSTRLAPLIVACPSSAIVADTASAAASSRVMSPSNASSIAMRVERDLRAISMPATLVGPTVEAFNALRAVEVRAAVRRQ